MISFIRPDARFQVFLPPRRACPNTRAQAKGRAGTVKGVLVRATPGKKFPSETVTGLWLYWHPCLPNSRSESMQCLGRRQAHFAISPSFSSHALPPSQPTPCSATWKVSPQSLSSKFLLIADANHEDYLLIEESLECFGPRLNLQKQAETLGLGVCLAARVK